MANRADDLARIKLANASLNAFVEFATPVKTPPENTSKDGQFQAKSAETPLLDWTFAIKSNIAVAGLAHTAGIGGFRDRIAQHDAFCVARLRAAGAEVIGTANMEEAALGAVTNNPHFGKTQNPHRAGFTPGGSSGGSAAAVAAGLVRVALGTDTMGSCRIPAAYCGVVGFKPSFGRISTAGVEPLARRLDHLGILAMTVADVAVSFAVLDAFDRTNADSRREASPTPTDSPPRVLAVADHASLAGLSDEVARSYARALDVLTRSGYVLVPKSVDQARLAHARRAGLLICEAELANSLAPLLARDDGGISPALRKMIDFAVAKSAPQLAAAHGAIDDAELVLREQLADVDAICWPTAPQSAFAFAEPIPANQADFTCLANFTGVPAISLPMPVAEGQLPVGLQLMSARGSDRTLLDLAASIERVLSGSVYEEPMQPLQLPSLS